MARITVEDCFKMLSNKFELSILASYRAKEISKGAAIGIERNNDKNSVISLREIASDHVDIAKLRKAYIQSLQLHISSNDDIAEHRDTLNDKIHNQEKEEHSSDEFIENEFIAFDEEEALELDYSSDKDSEEE